MKSGAFEDERPAFFFAAADCPGFFAYTLAGGGSRLPWQTEMPARVVLTKRPARAYNPTRER